jgi:5-methylcytosine-specific restriction endonuclease McrA
MKFELEDTLRGAPDIELLADMRRCALELGKFTLTIAEYEKLGRAHPSTLQRRFGSWRKALQLADLQLERPNILLADEDYYLNIKSAWLSVGRQPRMEEMKPPLSKIWGSTYARRFGSWSNALQCFIDWVNDDDGSEPPSNTAKPSPAISRDDLRKVRRGPRGISERQRFRTLVRDGFRCRSCGASPLATPGTELHVDHILPWSLGGESVDENLETKCARCNLGKGNEFQV